MGSRGGGKARTSGVLGQRGRGVLADLGGEVRRGDHPAVVAQPQREPPDQPGIGGAELELSVAGRWVAEYYPCERVDELGDGRLLVELRTPDTRLIRRLKGVLT